MAEAEEIGHYSQQTCEIAELEDKNFEVETNYKYIITWEGSEAIDFINFLNAGDTLSHVLCSYTNNVALKTKIIKTREDAVIPERAHFSDTGFDVTAIDVLKSNKNVTYYSTGIKAQPPHGYYFELVPRSSISKTGYIMANNIGIIDQNYRGEIIIALMKIDESAEDIKLPYKICQLIPKQWFNMKLEVDKTISETQRSCGGFGSTT